MKLKSFSKKIIVITMFLTIVPLILIGCYYGVSVYENLKTAAYQKADVQIEHTNDTVNTNFDVIKLLIYKILGNDQLIEIFENDETSIKGKLTEAEKKLSEDVYLSYGWSNGVVESVYVFKNESTYARVTRSPYSGAEIENNKKIYKNNNEKAGIVITPPESDGNGFSLSVPLVNVKGKNLAYIVMYVNAKKLSDTLKNIKVDASMTYVVDKNNIIYASSNIEDIGKVLTVGEIYKKDYLDSESEFFVITKILNSVILTKLFKSLAVYILVFVLIVLIAAIFVVVLLKNITEPLKKLVSVIKKFDSGNWEARVPSFNDDEIDMIGNAFNSMCENINNLVNVVYQKEILIRDAQMLALQSQINPHFLFNTLTTIATIAKKNKDEEVSGLIRNLSKLLRELAIIKDDGFSTLESELLTVDYYVSIQKVRFADRFEYILEKSDNVPENCRIPKLLIQPLVENAFCHGIETKIDGGYIKVRISCEDKYLVIEIIDNGVGFEKSKVFTEDEHTHITLSNIKKRLAVYYDEDFVFNINSRTDKGTNVYIRFPV